jgi:hypothetical protein
MHSLRLGLYHSGDARTAALLAGLAASIASPPPGEFGAPDLRNDIAQGLRRALVQPLSTEWLPWTVALGYAWLLVRLLDRQPRICRVLAAAMRVFD